MDLYKQVKTITWTAQAANEVFDLGGSQYKHKAFSVHSSGSNSNNIQLAFWWNNSVSNWSSPIAISDVSTNITADAQYWNSSIIPIRVAKLKIDGTGTIQITLYS